MVKHLSTMREAQVRSLGWEDLREKGMGIYSSILAWRTMDRGACWATVRKESDRTERLHFHIQVGKSAVGPRTFSSRKFSVQISLVYLSAVCGFSAQQLYGE